MSADEFSDKEQEVISSFKNFVTDIQSEELGRRKKALQDLNKRLFSNEDYSLSLYQKAFAECHLQVIRSMRDKSEICREISINILSNFINKLEINDFYLTYIFPVLVERIGTPELIEESEELRLEMLTFLSVIINRYSKTDQLAPFLNDMITILCHSVVDKFPKAKEASFKCIMELADALPTKFHLQCDSLVTPVLKSFTHQHYKIRGLAIKTIGIIMMHSTSGTVVEKTVVPLAERLFDQTATVRQIVAQVACQLLTEYRDRYSFFHKILPLILTGLCDEVPETRLEVEKLWAKVGEQYAKENEKDLKDQLDYPMEVPEHYPKDVVRPSLGCRTLVQRNASKMIAGVCNELSSWQEDVRIRCAQLLCIITLHCEQFATQGLQDVLPAMYNACELQREQHRSVHENVMRAARYAGAFVPVKAWSALVIPATKDVATVGHLRILRSMAEGAPQTELQQAVIEIGDLLSSEPIRCGSRKPQYLTELIESCRVLMDFPEISSQLFTVLVTVMSLCTRKNTDSQKIMDSARDLLNKIESPEIHIQMVLKELSAFGTVVSPDRCVLDTLLFEWNNALIRHLPNLTELLKKALDDQCDAEARLNTFEALSTFLQSEILAQFSAAGDFGAEIQKFATEIIKEILIPAVVWRAGRTAEALRTAASVCLTRALPHALVELLAEDDDFTLIVSTLVVLSDDTSWLTRLSGARCLNHLGKLVNGNEARQRRWANDASIAMLKRLDDPHDMVRFAAMDALVEVLHGPNLLEPQNMRHLVDTVLIHIDDRDDDTVDAIMKILKEVKRSDWTYLHNKVKDDLQLFRNKSACEELLKFLNSHSDENSKSG